MQVLGVISRSAALEMISSPSAVESPETHATKERRTVIVRWAVGRAGYRPADRNDAPR